MSIPKETSSMRYYSTKRNPKILLIVLVLLLFHPGSVVGRKKKIKIPPLGDQIEQIIKASPIANGFIGLEVYSLDQNKILFEGNSDKLFVPASNTKIFTTATAIAKLPHDFRFRTTLESTGKIDKFGRLNGDLVLVGRGDPNLSNRNLPYDPKSPRVAPPTVAIESLANQLSAKGVKLVDGDIIGDDSYFVNEPYGDSWNWDDLMWWWGAPASALTINDNVFTVSISPGEAVGDRAYVTLEPFLDSIQVMNNLITTPPNTERKIRLERDPGSRILRLWGIIPFDSKPETEILAIEEPARIAAEGLKESLHSKGIHVMGKVRVHHLEVWELPSTLGSRPQEAISRPVLAEMISHPLLEDLKVIDKVSQNLHAEMLLRLIGAQLKNEGSVRAGLEAEREFLKEAGVDEKLVQLNDGSGMSGHNLVAPHAVVQLYKYLWSQPYRDAWIDLLPVSGTDGTIGSRFKGTIAEGKIHAKTGTLTHVNALSGYATSTRGEHLIFSMFVNNHTQESKAATSTMDKILETILAYPQTVEVKSTK